MTDGDRVDRVDRGDRWRRRGPAARVAGAVTALVLATAMLPFDVWASPALAPPAAAFNCALHTLLGLTPAR